VNVEGTRNVLAAVVASRTVRLLCYPSTLNVLGCPPERFVWTEESNPDTSRRPRLHFFSCAEDALTVAETARRPGG